MLEVVTKDCTLSLIAAMAGGAPVPVPVSDPEDTILSIADLEKAASKKLGKTAGGMSSNPV